MCTDLYVCLNTAKQSRQTSFDGKSYFVFGHFLPVTDAFPLAHLRTAFDTWPLSRRLPP